jgi:hypothetical protein
MKWITSAHPNADQAGCTWLIKHFLDKNAEFIFVADTQVAAEAERIGATPYAVVDVTLGLSLEESVFEVIVKRYELTADPALMLLGKIVRGVLPESAGLKAVAEGFKQLSFKDNDMLVRAEWVVFDALYGYCIQSIIHDKPNGMFRP